MKLPKELITVTPLSKYLAMVVFVALPLVGFFFGMRYSEMLGLAKRQEMEENLSIPRTPTPTPLVVPTVDPLITNWKTYIGETAYTTDGSSKFSIKYPPNWKLEGDRLYPLGENSDKGYESRIILGAGGHGGFPDAQGSKNYPAGTAYYYLKKDRSGKWISGYVIFPAGKISYIFEVNFLPVTYEDTLNEILTTFKFTNQEVIPPQGCTKEAKLCPDGKTYVSRQPPICDFAPCPKSTNYEGKFCGGIAANLPENQCPTGYKCQLDGAYPDAGGKCVKE